MIGNKDNEYALFLNGKFWQVYGMKRLVPHLMIPVWGNEYSVVLRFDAVRICSVGGEEMYIYTCWNGNYTIRNERIEAV
jgi:hypothetical protein